MRGTAPRSCPEKLSSASRSTSSMVLTRFETASKQEMHGKDQAKWFKVILRDDWER